MWIISILEDALSSISDLATAELLKEYSAQLTKIKALEARGVDVTNRAYELLGKMRSRTQGGSASAIIDAGIRQIEAAQKDLSKAAVGLAEDRSKVENALDASYAQAMRSPIGKAVAAFNPDSEFNKAHGSIKNLGANQDNYNKAVQNLDNTLNDSFAFKGDTNVLQKQKIRYKT